MQGEGLWKKNMLKIPKVMRLDLNMTMLKSAWQQAGFFSCVARSVVLASIRRGKQIVMKFYLRNLTQVTKYSHLSSHNTFSVH